MGTQSWSVTKGGGVSVKARKRSSRSGLRQKLLNYIKKVKAELPETQENAELLWVAKEAVKAMFEAGDTEEWMIAVTWLNMKYIRQLNQ